MAVLLKLVLLIGLIFWQASQASAQSQCAPRDMLASELKKQYNETVQARAITRSGNMLELYLSNNGDTFTIVLSRPEQNVSCLTASGESWTIVEPEPEGEPL